MTSIDKKTSRTRRTRITPVPSGPRKRNVFITNSHDASIDKKTRRAHFKSIRSASPRRSSSALRGDKIWIDEKFRTEQPNVFLRDTIDKHIEIQFIFVKESLTKDFLLPEEDIQDIRFDRTVDYRKVYRQVKRFFRTFGDKYKKIVECLVRLNLFDPTPERLKNVLIETYPFCFAYFGGRLRFLPTRIVWKRRYTYPSGEFSIDGFDSPIWGNYPVDIYPRRHADGSDNPDWNECFPFLSAFSDFFGPLFFDMIFWAGPLMCAREQSNEHTGLVRPTITLQNVSWRKLRDSLEALAEVDDLLSDNIGDSNYTYFSLFLTYGDYEVPQGAAYFNNIAFDSDDRTYQIERNTFRPYVQRGDERIYMDEENGDGGFIFLIHFSNWLYDDDDDDDDDDIQDDEYE